MKKFSVYLVFFFMFLYSFFSSYYVIIFREKILFYEDNAVWGKLSIDEHSDRGVIMIFGDSQIAFWKMAPSFGVLPVVNRGVAGDWATKAEYRFKNDIDLYVPSVVVLLIGTNDIANGVNERDAIKSVQGMVQYAKMKGACVVVCSILPVRGNVSATRPLQKIDSLNNGLRDVSAVYGAVYVDLFSVLADSDGVLRSEYSLDDLHVNRNGYVAMAKVVLPIVGKAYFDKKL